MTRSREGRVAEPYEPAAESRSDFISPSAHQTMLQEVTATESPGSSVREGAVGVASTGKSSDPMSQSNGISGDTEAHAAASLESSVDHGRLYRPLIYAD